MSFNPRVLHPEPDPAFVRDLHTIDPDLRAIWGYERYLLNRWVIERKIPPERYVAMYGSLLKSDQPRFVNQPITDADRPIFGEPELDQDGNWFLPLVGYTQIGVRKYDLAPDHECVLFVENHDKSYRPLDQRTLLTMRRTYAWERFHSLTRLKIEKDLEREHAEKHAKAQRVDEVMDAIMEQRREIWDLPFVGPARTVMPGTSLK